MNIKNLKIPEILTKVMQLNNKLPNQLAKDIGVNHAMVYRWISGEDLPSAKSCAKLAKYSGLPLENLLFAAGHLTTSDYDGTTNWPEFREYARRKYPHEMDEDMIAMIEKLIEQRRKQRQSQNSRK